MSVFERVYNADARREMLKRLPPERREIVRQLQQTNRMIEDAVKAAKFRTGYAEYLMLKEMIADEIEHEQYKVKGYIENGKA